MNLKIAIVGAGNVASFFAKKFAAAGFTIVSIHSKNLAHAESLASEVQAIASNTLSTIGSDFDYLFFAVSDDALKACVAEVPASNNFCWLHTSGAMSKEIFAEKTNRYGVFYPLQTFTKSVALSQSVFPVLIESSSEEIQQANKPKPKPTPRPDNSGSGTPAGCEERSRLLDLYDQVVDDGESWGFVVHGAYGFLRPIRFIDSVREEKYEFLQSKLLRIKSEIFRCNYEFSKDY